MAAVLNANLPNFFIQWPNDATLTLIQNRRSFQHQFTSTPLNEQRRLWGRIARRLNNIHPNFALTRNQCRNKWNALKSGYENLKRLLNNNPEGFLTRTLTLHDERFHEELSDEFWLVERNYLLFN